MSVSLQDPVPKKIVIVGAGVGGLTTALACLHHGHEVTLLEQAPALGEVGAGIQIPPNAMKVFHALGLDKEIAAHGFAPQALEARMGKTGLRLFRVDVKENAVPQWGAPYLQIHRADYISVLAQALSARAPEALVLDAALVDIQQNDKEVRATLADGRSFVGDVLIGADGLHSAVRRHLHGADHGVFTGNVAWRATIPLDKLGDRAPDPTACVWMGRGRHCVTYRLRGGNEVNFVGVVEHNNWPKDFRTASLQNESWSRVGDKSEALADFAGWHKTITDLIEHMETPHQWALFDRQPLKKWAEGRVALLGDAAHPMLPFMAQGAAMAVEDAWVLARALVDSGPRRDDVYLALMRYQRARHRRASLVQARSRENADTFHQRHLFGQLKTYAPMWLGGRLVPKAVRARLDWLYGYDVTKLP
jgi:salicylate hydroxylase